MLRLAAGLLFCIALVGCGAGSPGCTSTLSGLTVRPATDSTVPDHAAKAPGNQEQFLAYPDYTYSPHCAVPAVLAPANAAWTVSDAVNVSISSAPDSTNGLATCLGATSQPAVVTGTFSSQGQTVSSTTNISCK